jgi:hypothetical protein
VAILSVILFVAAAFAVDIGNLVVKKQALGNTLDAVSLAGAVALPDMAAARAAVGRSLANNDPNKYAVCATTPSAEVCPQPIFYCILPATAGGTPDLSFVHKSFGTSTLASACNPGIGGLAASGASGKFTWSCTAGTCRIEMDTSSRNNLLGCDQVTPATCANAQAMSVSGSESVPYVFGPVIGKPNGNTGTIRSVACGASCGAVDPGPLDMVIIADRTASMKNYMSDETTAISGALQSLTSATRHVALGTVGEADNARKTCGGLNISPDQAGTAPGSVEPNNWIPVGLSNDYSGSTPGTLNASSNLVKAVNCLDGTPPWTVTKKVLAGNVATLTTRQMISFVTGDTVVVTGVDTTFNGTYQVTGVPTATTFTYAKKHADVLSANAVGAVNFETMNSNSGTWLASPLKLATSYLLGQATLDNGGSPQSRAGKAIIFETDEQPNEKAGSDVVGASCSSLSCFSDNLTLGNSSMQFVSRTRKNEQVQACLNFQAIAAEAKALGVTIAIVTYNPGSSSNCQSILGLTHDPAASSDGGSGYLVFTANNAADLAAQFKAAIVAVGSRAKLISLP